jgi:Tol biopolymer transport system component
VATASSVQVVPPDQVKYIGLTFSRDGDFIYYVVREKNNATPTLYQVPVLGGTARRLIEDVGSPITLSPDGKRLAFIRPSFSQGERKFTLVVANADGSGEQALATRKLPDCFASAIWSPNGKTIACGVESFSGGWHETLVEVSVEGETEKPMTTQKWYDLGSVAWY